MMRWSYPELAGVCIYRESGENFQDTFHRPAPEPTRLYGGRQNLARCAALQFACRLGRLLSFARVTLRGKGLTV